MHHRDVLIESAAFHLYVLFVQGVQSHMRIKYSTTVNFYPRLIVGVWESFNQAKHLERISKPSFIPL